jgi:uncharacterized protein
MIRLLKPWHAHIKKRQVKSPTVYYRDSDLLHCVFGLHQQTDILTHPKAGASFEGFLIEVIIKHYAVEEGDCYFWASHNKAELDLLIIAKGAHSTLRRNTLHGSPLLCLLSIRIWVWIHSQ